MRGVYVGVVAFWPRTRCYFKDFAHRYEFIQRVIDSRDRNLRTLVASESKDRFSAQMNVFAHQDASDRSSLWC
jgi:hypothetical protein